MNKIESLYIHIPYCLSKCKYCDFFSVTCKQSETFIPDSYVNALCNEILFRIHTYNVTNLKTIYIGGGTPSLLKVEQLYKIIDTVNKSVQLDKNAEITVELNPDDINIGLIKGLERAGVTRLSVGIQSMDDKVLRAVGRRADRKTNLQALDCICKNWKGNFSIDLISGLPYETEQSFENGLNEVIKYQPNHISLYSLVVEDETPLGQLINSNLIEYDYDFSDELWIKGKEVLIKSGYLQYEVSNFAKKTFESKHNLTYWKHQNYLGCGVAATGTVYPGRWTNTTNIEKYIDYWSDATGDIPQNQESVSLSDEKFEYFMMGLRKLEGISNSEYKYFFNEDIPQNIKKVFLEWNKKNLLEISEEKDVFYRLNDKGILFLNKLLQEIEC